VDIFRSFNLKATYFDRFGKFHGISHTYRVMCNVLVLGDILKLKPQTDLAFFAAYIHDMSRKHDGKCLDHGKWAAENKFPVFKSLFALFGLKEQDEEEVKFAVTNHSKSSEVPQDHKYYLTTALLKDADCLDRIRLGEEFINLSYIRFHETLELLEPAKNFYYLTKDINDGDFQVFFNFAETVYDRKIMHRFHNFKSPDRS
jgi:hypothetical protein